MRTFTFLILACTFSVGFSQKGNSIAYNQSDLANFNDTSNVILYHDDNINGEEYLYGPWNKGMLVMHDSLFFAQNYLRYDAYNDRILIKMNTNDDNKAFQINDSNLTGFSIVDANTNMKHDFVKLNKDYFDVHDPDGFYEVVFNIENKNYLLKKTKKYIYDPNKSKGVAAMNNLPSEFKEKVTYFIKNDKGIYVPVRLKKKDILKILKKHPAELEAYINEHHTHFNQETEVVNLVNYYYSLNE